jgi:hypothetical protein
MGAAAHDGASIIKPVAIILRQPEAMARFDTGPKSPLAPMAAFKVV